MRRTADPSALTVVVRPCSCTPLSLLKPLRPIVTPEAPQLLVLARREQVLKEAGFRDIFRPVKDKENRLALQLLPQLLAQLDCISNATQRCARIMPRCAAPCRNPVAHMQRVGLLA